MVLHSAQPTYAYHVPQTVKHPLLHLWQTLNSLSSALIEHYDAVVQLKEA